MKEILVVNYVKLKNKALTQWKHKNKSLCAYDWQCMCVHWVRVHVWVSECWQKYNKIKEKSKQEVFMCSKLY